jgi:hypothetical protein
MLKRFYKSELLLDIKVLMRRSSNVYSDQIAYEEIKPHKQRPIVIFVLYKFIYLPFNIKKKLNMNLSFLTTGFYYIITFWSYSTL